MELLLCRAMELLHPMEPGITLNIHSKVVAEAAVDTATTTVKAFPAPTALISSKEAR